MALYTLDGKVPSKLIEVVQYHMLYRYPWLEKVLQRKNRVIAAGQVITRQAVMPPPVYDYSGLEYTGAAPRVAFSQTKYAESLVKSAVSVFYGHSAEENYALDAANNMSPREWWMKFSAMNLEAQLVAHGLNGLWNASDQALADPVAPNMTVGDGTGELSLVLTLEAFSLLPGSTIEGALGWVMHADLKTPLLQEAITVASPGTKKWVTTDEKLQQIYILGKPVWFQGDTDIETTYEGAQTTLKGLYDGEEVYCTYLVCPKLGEQFVGVQAVPYMDVPQVLAGTPGYPPEGREHGKEAYSHMMVGVQIPTRSHGSDRLNLVRVLHTGSLG